MVGMVYGLWLGNNVEATDADARNAFVIVMLSTIVALSLCADKESKDTEEV